MKLYLSSYRVPTPDDLFDLVNKQASEIKVALIPNAKDYYAGRARDLKINEVVNDFKKIGLEKLSIFDLRDHSSSEKLQKDLEDYDLIWAMGGNTFILRYEMQRSGFDAAISRLLESGKVYGGESAGALVAGNSLKGIEYADEPEFSEKVVWDGLGLTDHFVLPHVGSMDFGDAIENAKLAHQHDPTLVELTDQEAFIVNGSHSIVVKSES